MDIIRVRFLPHHLQKSLFIFFLRFIPFLERRFFLVFFRPESLILDIFLESGHECAFTSQVLLLQGDIRFESACAVGEVLFSAGLSESQQNGQPGEVVESAQESRSFHRAGSCVSCARMAKKQSRVLAAEKGSKAGTVTRFSCVTRFSSQSDRCGVYWVFGDI